MPHPLVSILIPCYNAKAYVGEAIESALGQTHPNVEVIVVDDGSTDGSVEILRRFGDKIRFEAGPNRGACATRNRAFDLSSGEFVQFLDADDLLLPEKIEKQLPPLLSGEVDCVICRAYIFGDGRGIRPEQRPRPDPAGLDPFAYFCRVGVQTAAPLHRRSTVANVGGFRVGLPRAQEWDFHLRLAAADMKLSYTAERLYCVRDHNGPRITRSSGSKGYLTQLSMELAKLLTSGAPFRMDGVRRRVFGEYLYRCSIIAYRNGCIDVAQDGFEAAFRLSREFVIPERAWYRALVRYFGPMPIEGMMEQARRFRSALRAA